MSTSGSTGDVKCVRLGYAGIKAHACALTGEIGFGKSDSAITTMPLAFVYTLSFVNFHIMQGATIVMTNRSILEKEFWDLFSTYQPTCISGLNLHYEMLDRIKFFDKECSHIKIFTQGGDIFSLEMRKKVNEYCRRYEKNVLFFMGRQRQEEPVVL